MISFKRTPWFPRAIAITAVGCVCASGAAQVRPAKPPASMVGGYVTARAELVELTGAARAWRRDAVLCWVTTVVADEQGRAQGYAGWDFRFCSKSSGQEYAVAHTPAGFTGRVVGKADHSEVSADFIDSDRAVAAAKRAGFSPQANSIMTLDPGPDGKGLVWTIYGASGISELGKRFLVDAITGNVVRAGG